jgi:STE24 endopeptidase
MDATFVYYSIIAILVLEFLWSTLLNYLNAKRFNHPIPEELTDVYDADTYQKSQAYKRRTIRLDCCPPYFPWPWCWVSLPWAVSIG